MAVAPPAAVPVATPVAMPAATSVAIPVAMPAATPVAIPVAIPAAIPGPMPMAMPTGVNAGLQTRPPAQAHPGPPSAAAAGGVHFHLPPQAMASVMDTVAVQEAVYGPLRKHRPLGHPETWPLPFRKLFLGNLPSWVEEDDVRDICLMVGANLEEVKVYHQAAGSGQSCAKVVVSHPVHKMRDLVQELHGHLH